MFRRHQQQLYHFQQQFRCPICFGGTTPKLQTRTSPASNSNNNSINEWMTGHELDHHINTDMITHRKLRTNKLRSQISKLRRSSSALCSSPSNSISSESNQNKNDSPRSSITRNLFESEMKSLLSALPNSSLVDRYLVLDTSNAQHRTSIGTLSSIQEIDFLWRAFLKERICVVFIQENLFENAAPIFDTLGALAEGSANVHDNNNNHQNHENNCKTEAPALQLLPLWRRRGEESRLGGCVRDMSSILPKKRTTIKQPEQQGEQDEQKMLNEKQERAMFENPLRPWNSVVIPTVRGAESGDFALYETLLTLRRMIVEDEEREMNDRLLLRLKNDNDDDIENLEFTKRMMMTTRKSRGMTTKARIDFVSEDRELLEAAEAALLSEGRFTVHPNLNQFTISALR